jgi:hypothetical protein
MVARRGSYERHDGNDFQVPQPLNAAIFSDRRVRAAHNVHLNFYAVVQRRRGTQGDHLIDWRTFFSQEVT